MKIVTDISSPISRQALKKYILANNKTNAASPAVFDAQFNKALRTGVEKGDFTQPKGMLFLFPFSCLSLYSSQICRGELRLGIICYHTRTAHEYGHPRYYCPQSAHTILYISRVLMVLDRCFWTSQVA